jgi:hypothetical protein
MDEIDGMWSDLFAARNKRTRPRRSKYRLRGRMGVFLSQEELELLETVLCEYGDADDLDVLYTPEYGEMKRKVSAALTELIWMKENE